MQKKKTVTPFDILNYAILSVAAVVCIMPFIHLLAVSFSESSAVSAGLVGFWPVDFTLQSYEFALTGGRFLKSLLVSVERVILGCLVNMVLMVLTAYPLSKTKQNLLGRNIYMTFFVITMIISGGLIPTYLVVTKAGLLNSIWALVLPGALPVYNMVILMNFIRGLPEELEEAARIDGAGNMTILIQIVLPLLKPALATVGLFCMVNHWNDWFSGMIYMQSPENYPLQTYLQTLLRNFEDILKSAGSDYSQLISMMNVRTGRAAQLFLGALPIMAVYPFLQKYFTTGLVMGSVKG